MIINFRCEKCGRSHGLEPRDIPLFNKCLSCNGRLIRQEA